MTRVARASFAAVLALVMVLSAGLTTAQAQTTSVTAAWDRNSDAITTGYLVQYGTSPGNYQWTHDAGNSVSAQLTLTQGATYYVSVRAYTSSAQLGPASNEATINLVTTPPPPPPAPTATLTATLQNGNTAVVTWQTSNATAATINGNNVALSGTQSVPVSATTTFTLVARNAAGTTVTRTATVTIAPVAAPTASISATLQNGNTAVVTWQTSNATAATINGNNVALSGTQSVPVSATTTFTLVARNAAGASVTRSTTLTVTPPSTAVPTASISGVFQNGNAVLTWTSTNGVRAEINGNNVALSGTISLPISSTTSYRLLVTAANGRMAEATTTVVATSTTGAPLAPTSMAAAVSNARVTFSWAPPVTGARPDRYLIDVGYQGSSRMLVSAYPVGNGTSVSNSFAPGSYWTRIRAANAAGVSGYSNMVMFSVGRRLPTPSSLSVQWSGSTARLSWTAPAADGPVEDIPTAYVLEAGTAAGLSDIAAINLGNSTEFAAPIPSGTYYVRVRAINEAGQSAPTEDVVLSAPGAPGAPTDLVASGSLHTVTLRWQAPTGAGTATAYQLEAGSAPGLSDIAVAQVGNVTSFSTPIPPGNYYIRVKALNGVGAGASSNEVVVTR